MVWTGGAPTVPDRPFVNGAVTVGTTAIKLCSVDSNDGVLVQNTGTVAVFLGGSGVTATGATQGLSVAASSTVLVPSAGGGVNDLYAVTASSTATVVFLFPAA